MAILSNINGLFAVEDNGAIKFNNLTGTNNQVLIANTNSSPTWVDVSTIIGGPYLPLTGGTLAGAGNLVIGGTLAVNGVTTLNASTTITRDSSGYALRLDSADSTTDNDLRFAKGGVDYAAIQVSGATNSNFQFYVNDGTNWINTLNFARADGQAVFTKLVSGITPTAAANFTTKAYVDAHPGSGGTVTSVGGTGSVSGITLTGTVTTTGNLTLGGTLSASITNISDAARWWNNFGDNHSTRTSFDASTASYGFGWRFVQGNTNGPGTGGTQFYSAYVGLGNNYPSTGSNSYGAYLAFDRDVTNPYLSIRYNENNVLSTWRKISAGTADILTTARTIAGVSFNGSADISLNNNAITNGAGYTTNTGTVTSVATGNGLTGGTITTTGTLAMSGSYTGTFTVDSTGDVEYLALNTTATANKRVRIQFTQNDNAGMEIGTDYSVDNSSNFYFYDRVAGSVMFFTSVASSFFPGSLRIGMTAASSQKLHVQGSNHFVTFENTSTTANHYAQILLKAGNRENYIWTANQNSTAWGGAGSLNIYTNDSGSSIAFFTQGDATNTKLMIEAGGSIGINKTTGLNAGGFGSPKLVIKQSVNNEWGGVNVEATNNDAVFAFGTTDDAHKIAGSYRATAGYKPIHISTAGNIRMVLDTSGNVGIGTTLPAQKLTVNGNIGFTGFLGQGSIYGNTGNASYTEMQLYNPATGFTTIDNKAYGYYFATAGSTKLTILNNGNVGIGVTGPTEKLEISGKVKINSPNAPNSFAELNIGWTSGGETRAIDIDGNWTGNENKSITFTHGSAATNIVGQINCQHNGPGSRIRWGKLYHSGDSSTYTMELISSSQTTANLTVAGNITAAADVVAYSDERLKSNIKTLDGSKVLKMRGVSFEKEGKKGSGVIAQELEKVAPELVNNDNEYKGVAYGNLTGYLIEAIKELEARVKELENK